MDVPILTAIIGVGGTLAGTIIGGCLTTFTNFLVKKRQERAEFRIGCRLITSELSEYEDLFEAALEAKAWWSPGLEPGTKAWEEHRHVLASLLPDGAWDDVQLAIRRIHFFHHLSVTGSEGQLDVDKYLQDVDKYPRYTEALHESMEVLQNA
jgi:hypothetical protein